MRPGNEDPMTRKCVPLSYQRDRQKPQSTAPVQYFRADEASPQVPPTRATGIEVSAKSILRAIFTTGFAA